MTISRKNLTLATAIPVAAAVESFEEAQIALLAVFVMGLAMGVDEPSLAAQLIEHGTEVLSDKSVSGQWEKFLSSTLSLTENLIGNDD